MVSPQFWCLLLVPAVVHATSQNWTRAKQNITQCLTSANVPQNLPGTANFTQAINPFNQRLSYTPVAVAVPTTVAQVQAAVNCGVGLNITISPKSGGHSYAAHGIGGEDGHLMVDMKYFYNVTVDNTTKIATIQPGARLGNVAQSLYAQGKVAISHGTCAG
jgi:FAD/FMN-containing dehydrogenase